MSLYDTNTIISSNGINYDWKGDYLGFSYGGIHSSELGIVRISDSDKYNDELIPTFSDKTATVPGLDETYYFGSDYTQKIFTIKFAFDYLTDLQIRRLRKLFSNKEPQELIFDETPYKIYIAKTNGQPNLNYLCFDENFQRIYKGDGSVTFIAYSPFAKSRFKYVEDYNINTIPEWAGTYSNKMEWLESSGIVNKNFIPPISNIDKSGRDLDVFNNSNNRLQLYNPGDFEVSPIIYISCSTSSSTFYRNIWIEKNHITNDNYSFNTDNGGIQINLTSLDPGDRPKGFIIDCKKKLIYGIKKIGDSIILSDNTTWESDGKIYNNYITEGDFFNIPLINKYDSYLLCISGTGNSLIIKYDYLYY